MAFSFLWAIRSPSIHHRYESLSRWGFPRCSKTRLHRRNAVFFDTLYYPSTSAPRPFFSSGVLRLDEPHDNETAYDLQSVSVAPRSNQDFATPTRCHSALYDSPGVRPSSSNTFATMGTVVQFIELGVFGCGQEDGRTLSTWSYSTNAALLTSG